MAKRFIVSTDFIMSKTFEIEAENEEQAMEIARSQIDENPYGYARGFSHYVAYDIIEAHEED